MHAVARLEEGMRFAADAGSGQRVMLDMLDEQGGEAKSAGSSPMEMLLIGLAGCTGMSVLSILHARRQEITGYEVQVVGFRAEEHPKVFVDITVEHIITGHNVRPELVARAIELTETRYCGVEVMLGKTAMLHHTYQIVEHV
jgi:putative redox protein